MLGGSCGFGRPDAGTTALGRGGEAEGGNVQLAAKEASLQGDVQRADKDPRSLLRMRREATMREGGYKTSDWVDDCRMQDARCRWRATTQASGFTSAPQEVPFLQALAQHV